MNILVDTNILLRSVQIHHPQYTVVETALAVIKAQEKVLCVCIQNLIEFWAVATRPCGSTNGLGFSTAAAAKELECLKEFFQVLPESNLILDCWEQLVKGYGVSGKTTHDARLVATMKLNGVTQILTFNVQDFSRFEGIEAIHPESVG